MKTAHKFLMAAAMAGMGVIGWSAHDVMGAQAVSKPTVMKRFYTGADGLSHVEDVPLNVKTVMENITKVEVHISKAGNFSDYHVAPRRQYIINLSGDGEVELADGKVALPPGSIEYIDDTTGKGHTTRVTSSEQRVSLWFWFDDQKPHLGPMTK